MIVHMLRAGQALCGLAGTPNMWPPDHVWVAEGDSNANCRGCLAVSPIKKILCPDLDKLIDAYEELYPDERTDREDARRIYGNWLEVYKQDPKKAVAKANWYGKVTKAMFRALGVKQPRSVKEMLRVLCQN